MNKSVSKTILWSCIRPFQLLFFEQMCLNLCLLSALLLGILYLFFGASRHALYPTAWMRELIPMHRHSLSYLRTIMDSARAKPVSLSSVFLLGWS